MSARSFSLGQTSALSTSDIVDIFGNPSSVSRLNNIAASLNYSVQGDKYDAIDFGFGIPTRYGLFGFVYHRNTIVGLIRTSVLGKDEGTFSVSKNYYTIGYSRRLFDQFCFGLNGNILSERIDQYKSSVASLGLDLSFQYRYNFKHQHFRGVAAGLLFKNLVKPGIAYESSKHYSPLDVIMIIENDIFFGQHSFTLIGNFDYYVRKKINDKNALFKNKDILGYHLAVEYSINSIVFLRLGYYSDSISVVKNGDEYGDYLLSYGIGLTYLNIGLNYGYGSYGDRYPFFEPIHKISFCVRM
jgi:hypothetical protein